MTLTKDYKLVYEVITTANGESTRTFKASKERYPTKEDITILERKIPVGSSELVYEYKGHFYVAKGNTPSYGADGVPKDTRISNNENFCKVFGLEYVPDAPALNDEQSDTGAEVNETGDPDGAA